MNCVNTLGTKGKWKKKIISHPNLKGKKARHLECMLGPSSHWLHKIFLPKRESSITYSVGGCG
jgi:hypothetical protein